MNEIVNKFLIASGKVIHEVHLRQPAFTCSACEPFTKNNEGIEKFTEMVDSQYFYQNELDKACIQHDIAYREFKDLPRIMASDKIFPDKGFNIAKIQNMMDINVSLLLWFIAFLIKVFWWKNFSWCCYTSK